MTSLTTSSNRDMCAPRWSGPSSTKQSSLASYSSAPMRMTFSTLVTPTRDSDSRTEGSDACTSGELCVVASVSLERLGLEDVHEPDLPVGALDAGLDQPEAVQVAQPEPVQALGLGPADIA